MDLDEQLIEDPGAFFPIRARYRSCLKLESGEPRLHHKHCLLLLSIVSSFPCSSDAGVFNTIQDSFHYSILWMDQRTCTWIHKPCSVESHGQEQKVH